MRMRSISLLGLLALALASVLAIVPALANNPIAVTSTGAPFKWNSFPILYTVDGGSLGTLSNAEANQLTADAFAAWTSVPTASLSVSQNGIGLGPDGDVDTVADFDAVSAGSSCPNSSLIIYDSAGTIADGLFGGGTSDSLLGFTIPCIDSGAGSILAMRVVLVVKSLTTGTVSTLSRSKILGVFTHEFGHGLGLGHSQVNLNCQITPASCPSNTPGGDVFGVPTMYPFLLSQTETASVSFQATLSADDVSAISSLYSSPAFAASFGTISGTVFFGDAINHFQGANVIARRVLLPGGAAGDPRVTAVSNVSGMFAQVDHGNAALNRSPSSRGSPDPTKRGEYAIPGLPPGTYTVEAESVSSTFTSSGTSVGPIQGQRGDSFVLPAAACFGGLICQNVVLAAGNVLANNKVNLSDSMATMDGFDVAGPNDSRATATPIGAGTFFGLSISGNNGADVDFYAITVPAGQVFTAQTYSRRSFSCCVASTNRYLDSVIDLMDAGGNRLTTCRIGDDVTPFNQLCVDDDFTRAGARTLDSKFSYLAPVTTTVFLRVTDFLGDSRPDFGYDLDININPAQAEIPATTLDFGRQLVGAPPAVKSISIGNIGAADLILSSSPLAIANGPFVNTHFTLAGGSTCFPDLHLPTGGSCIVNIAFQTTGTGPGNIPLGSNLVVTSNAVASPQSFSLLGVGVDFSPTASTPKTVTAGQSASFNVLLNIFPLGTGLPTPTTFAVSGLPVGANCSFNPASFAADASSPSAISVMTISTTARSAALPSLPHRLPPPPVSFLLSSLVAAILTALTLARRWMFAPRWITRCSFLAVVWAFAALMACGGGGGGSGSAGTSGTSAGTPNPNGTPAGTYPLTVTITTGAISHTVPVTLTVQ